MATVQCPKCTVERKGFRRELDSWRHKLIHCVGFESILDGIYGPMLMRDLNVFDDCEPEEVDDWSPETSCSQCSFCNLPLDKLCDQATAATPPLSSPSDYSPCQAPSVSESSQSAHRFLQAVFNKNDVPLGCDSKIPLVAQELMRKMVHQFAMDYASKCLLLTSTNGVRTRTSSPLSETSDAPLDLTVSRTQEEKECEPEPDGALDLSNRTSACSTTSSSSSPSLSSCNDKASGSLLPSFKEVGDLGQQKNKHQQRSALDAVLSTLCPAHRSLLYQTLKLAQQDKLLSLLHTKPADQAESYSCLCGVTPNDKVTPHAVMLCECEGCNGSLYHPLMDCDHQRHGSTPCCSGDPKSNCSINLHPLKDSKYDGSLGSSYCCEQRCRMETNTVLCPKRLHSISCQRLTAGHINDMVSALIPSPTLSKSPLCTPSSTSCPPSSICCNQHTPHPCHCYSNHTCPGQVGSTVERGTMNGDPPCPVLKRERSPSPPPLSPIPSDISKKTDEKPPSLLHHRQEEDSDITDKHDVVNRNHLKSGVSTDAEEERQSRSLKSRQAEQNPSGTLLQDVVNRFSEKLETIKPLEKDPPPVSLTVNASEKELLQSPRQNLQCHADAHLTEIINKVLHRGNGCDYNLTELFNGHDSKEPKSPNTRSRRRQEVLTAIATPADDASARRHTLQIKREFASLDQSCNRRKGSPTKKTKLNDGKVSITTCASSDSSLVKMKSKKQQKGSEEPAEIRSTGELPLNMSAGSDMNEEKEDIQTAIATEDIHILKSEEKEWECEKNNLSHPVTQIPAPALQNKYGEQGLKGNSVQKVAEIMSETATLEKHCVGACKERVEVSAAGSGENHEAPPGESSTNCKRPVKAKNCNSPIREQLKSLPNHSKEVRRTRRNIVPPQRFSSYVVEPRKMFFVACFSESIFDQRIQKDNVLTSKALEAVSKDPVANDTQCELGNDSPLDSSEHTEDLAFESADKEQCGPSYTDSETMAAKEKSSTKCSLDIRTEEDCAAKHTRLRSFPKRLQELKAASGLSKKTSSKNVTLNSAHCVGNSLNSSVEYTSPIKLMFVSAVQGKEGVKYSLKSASTGANSQADKSFDPCVVSSWSGTPEKQKKKSTESQSSKVKSISPARKPATSPVSSSCSPTKSNSSSPAKPGSLTPKSTSPKSKSASSPKKCASPPKSDSSSPKTGSRRSIESTPTKRVAGTESHRSSPKASSSSPKSVSSSPKISSRRSGESTPTKRGAGTVSQKSPPKSGSSSSKSASSPKSVSSSPKIGSRRSGESTPTKRAAGTEGQRSCDLLAFHESTPQKRRPGRPKKLGPQLEQKVKRPIGRPRKQKAVDTATGTETVSGKVAIANEAEDNVNKNLKITVLYGRSRRNKRMVSEGFDQLQTEFHDACQAVGIKSDLGILIHNSKTSSGSIETASTKEFSFVSSQKESAPLSSRNIKCQKRDDSGPSRKPGRPAKVKISGISVTVTTVSPRQRKIQMHRDTRESAEAPIHKRVLPELKAAKEPRTISCQSTSRNSQVENKGIEAKSESKKRLQSQAVAVRHSLRVRKPSIHLLHAVATSTSRSYSHSNALLRRSKQLLLNKASNERKKEEQQSSVDTSGGRRQLIGQDKRKNISQDLSRVARMSVDSIFTPKDPLRWWAASAEEKTMNQQLANRIRLISDTWVSDSVENNEKDITLNSKSGTKGNSFTRKSKHSSVVRTLFDCSPNAPRSCSMKQLCSWFMQTTETQSLAIVKKESSRNLCEFRQVTRSANHKSVCPSPQAERLRKHIKKFAKMVPKSPLQHQQAQRRLRKRNKATTLSPHKIRRQLFTPGFAVGWFNQGVQWWRNRAFRNYQATVRNARTKFLTRKERERWQKSHNKKRTKVVTSCSNGQAVSGLQQKRKALHKPSKDQLFDCLGNSSSTSSVNQTQEPVDDPKEQNLCSKPWSPETLKECRVFLRKINSPDSESLEEEWDSCTVTLDDGSTSAYVFAGGESELVGVVKAVKTERINTKRRTASRELAGSAPKSVQEQDEMPERRQKGKYKGPGVVSTEPPQPPPAKMLRQSRMRGLTGPRWCDFVFEN